MSTSTRQPLRTPDIQRTRWRLDPERSSVEFHTKTFWGLVTVHRHFDRYDGTLDLREEQAIELTIDASTSTRRTSCATGTYAPATSST
jgi:polyisoprenoid-binding protein YceI